MTTLIILGFSFFALTGLVFAVLIKRCERKYKGEISFVENGIKTFDVNYANYLLLLGMLDGIVTRNNLDWRRTQKAHVEFLRKYVEFVLEFEEVEEYQIDVEYYRDSDGSVSYR